MFGNTLNDMISIFVIVEGNSRNRFQRYYLKNGKHFLTFLSHFCNLYEILRISKKKKKNQVHSLNILEVIQLEECVYINTRKLLFSNTPQESMCSWVKNTTESCTAAFLSYLSTNLRQTELENISLSQT